jgi:hypothetical protein
MPKPISRIQSNDFANFMAATDQMPLSRNTSADDFYSGIDAVFGFGGTPQVVSRDGNSNNEGVFTPTLSLYNHPPPPPPPPDATSIQRMRKEIENEDEDGSSFPRLEGETIRARVYAPVLGVMFYTPDDLKDTSLRDLDGASLSHLGKRPVVTFIASQGGAAQSDVRLGDICVTVNNVAVFSPAEAAEQIRKGSRPLDLTFIRTGLRMALDEGFHVVKYDTPDVKPPSKQSGWKPKYVVVGGIIAAPFMMMMYRSKAEYDIAVLEVTSNRRLSVKVKEFDLRGSRIVNSWGGAQLVHYKNLTTPLKYFVIQPQRGNPIKICSPTLAELEPVQTAVIRFLKGERDSATYAGETLTATGSYDEAEAHVHGRDTFANQASVRRSSLGGAKPGGFGGSSSGRY